MLCRAARHARARPLVDHTPGASPHHASLSTGYFGTGNPVRDRRRRGDAHRLHAASGPAFDHRPSRRRHPRQSGDQDRTDSALRLRRNRAMGEPARRRRAARHRRARHGDPAHACEFARRRYDHGRRIHRRRRRYHSLRAELLAVASTAACAVRPDHRASRYRDVLARLVGEMPARRTVVGCCAALDDHAQGADLCADGRNGCGSNHLAARAARRRAQLGLSFLLAARCHAGFARRHECRLLRGGSGLARLAITRGRRQPGSIADHVRHRRRAAADRVDRAVAPRLREFGARAHRQRRL